MKTNNLKTGIIYGLICPLSNEIRYVGQTIQTLNQRTYGHKYNTVQAKELAERRLTRKEKWILKLIALNKINDIKEVIIEECNFSLLDEREIYWIAYYKLQGLRLTNTLPGGNSRRGFKQSQETKNKISKSLKNSIKYQAAIKDPKRGKKISDKLKGYEILKVYDGVLPLD